MAFIYLLYAIYMQKRSGFVFFYALPKICDFVRFLHGSALKFQSFDNPLTSKNDKN